MVDRMCIMVTMRFLAALLLALTCNAQTYYEAIIAKDGLAGWLVRCNCAKEL